MLNPDPDPNETDEKPLDPAMLRVQQRLQRLMLIAGLTLGLGLIAVVFAIIYRINAADDRGPVPVASEAMLPPATIAAPSPSVAVPAPGPAAPVSPPASTPPGAAAPTGADKQAVLRQAKASVPADARLVASTVAGDRIVLTYEHFAGTLVLIFDPDTLAMVGRLEIAATP